MRPSVAFGVVLHREPDAGASLPGSEPENEAGTVKVNANKVDPNAAQKVCLFNDVIGKPRN